MTAGRPFEPRIVIRLGGRTLGGLREWAPRWEEVGADGLALEGSPDEPLVDGVAGLLRESCALPLELHLPEGVPPDPAWAGPLEGVLDWVVPGHPLPGEVIRALEGAGIRVAWPLGAAPPPGAARVHARTNRPDPGLFREAPAGAERSLTLAGEQTPVTPAGAGVDTLVLGEEYLDPADPAAALARWRG